MVEIVDAGPLVAAATSSGPEAQRIRQALISAPGPLIVPAPVTAEVDYLLTKLGGAGAARGFLQDVAAARFQVECLEPWEYQTILELGQRYAGLAPGLADLSIVVLAHRFRTHRVLTIDQRHFRAMTALDGEPFTLLPWDAA
jgi:hypothetical protein